MNRYNKKYLQLKIVFSSLLLAATASASVINTKHNLAHWSPYAYRAVSENRVCIFCHTPHNANPAGPLWSHQLSGASTFKKYSSSTLRILVDAGAKTESGYTSSGDASTVTGATKLCLGCHDGLTALGAITTGGGSKTIEMTIENLGGQSSGYDEDANTVNIQNKHPVSFNYNPTVLLNLTGGVSKKGAVYGMPTSGENGTAINPFVAEMVRRAGGRIECTICHDPHENKAAAADRDVLPFWISSSIDATAQGLGVLDSYEGVCASCHSQSFGEYTGFTEYTSLR